MSVKKIARRAAKRKSKQKETKVERKVSRLEARVVSQIESTFSDAEKDLQELADAYKQAWETQERRMQVLLNWGQITEAQYEQFLFDTIYKSEEYQRLAALAKQYVSNAGIAAADFVNDNLPWFFSQEANYTAYLIEGTTKGIVSFALLDEQAVRRLALRRPRLLPELHHNSAKSDKWVEQRLRQELVAGIVRGEDVDKIADRFSHVTHMPKAASVTNARTAITGARNGGRQETLDRAEVAGLLVEKQWQATLDYRTRDSHQHLDGERVNVDSRFSNGLMFPGDAYGPPEELYNCRCALRPIVNGNDPTKRIDNTTGDVINYMTYDEWLEMKEDDDES